MAIFFELADDERGFLLDELDGRASPVATFPWTDFPSRYREVSGRDYEFPDFALTRG